MMLPLPARLPIIPRAKLAPGLIGLALALRTANAWAGPPFLTDDPEPTDTGHWEIYAPYVTGDGRGADFSGDAGVELNYGAADNVQLTADLPTAFAHSAAGWQWGSGDLALSVKYWVINAERRGFQLAVFPAITLPTASNGLGAGRVTAFIPVWAQKDLGAWSVFGGGGYVINPGSGNRDYWTGGIAVARQLGGKLTLGLEADRRGADTIGGNGVTSLGAGFIAKLGGPFRLLASGGPSFADHRGGAGFHGYVALGIDY